MLRKVNNKPRLAKVLFSLGLLIVLCLVVNDVYKLILHGIFVPSGRMEYIGESNAARFNKFRNSN